MTDAERLAEIVANHKKMRVRANVPGPQPTNEEHFAWLVDMAERALDAEKNIQTILKDMGAEPGHAAELQRVLIEETARMVAAECAEVVMTARVPHGDQYGSYYIASGDAKEIATAIRQHFALDAGQQTLTQRVAAECAEIARTTLRTWDINAPDPQRRIAAAIRERFGLPTDAAGVDGHTPGSLVAAPSPDPVETSPGVFAIQQNFTALPPG